MDSLWRFRIVCSASDSSRSKWNASPIPASWDLSTPRGMPQRHAHVLFVFPAQEYARDHRDRRSARSRYLYHTSYPETSLASIEILHRIFSCEILSKYIWRAYVYIARKDHRGRWKKIRNSLKESNLIVPHDRFHWYFRSFFDIDKEKTFRS